MILHRTAEGTPFYAALTRTGLAVFVPPCTCGHAHGDHGAGNERCSADDSYGVRCVCPGFEADEDAAHDEFEAC